MSDLHQRKYDSTLKCCVSEDVKLKKEALALLCSIIHEIHKSFIKATLNDAENMPAIDAKMVQESIKPLIPENLMRYAFVNATRNVFLYQSGLVASQDTIINIEPVIADFKKGVKPILEDFNASAARGLMPVINTYLNDLCHALAKKSSQNAQSHNGVLAENDVLYAVDELLPQDLKQHAFARICHLQKLDILPPIRVREKTQTPVLEETSSLNESADIEMEETASNLNDSPDVEMEETAPKSSGSILGMALQMFYPVGVKSQTQTEEIETKQDEVKVEPQRKSLVGRALEWILPTKAQNDAEMNEETEDDETANVSKET